MDVEDRACRELVCRIASAEERYRLSVGTDPGRQSPEETGRSRMR